MAGADGFVPTRLARNSERQGGCRVWTGSKDRDGYGRISIDGSKRPAHRVAYEIANGPVPSGLVIDHLCRNRACINPKHLEAVAQSENIARSDIAVATINAAKATCIRGHEFDRVYVDKFGRTHRRCTECRRLTR